MRPESGTVGRGSGGLSVLLFLPVQAAFMIGVGLMVTGPLADHWPVAAEDAVNRALAAHRGVLAVSFSDWVSLLAGTRSIIGLTVVAVAAILGFSRGRWLPEALFLAVAVAAQSAVFLLVTLVVERPRPDVQLDAAPPTSSFPSGHVGASVALFGGLAVIAALHLRGTRRWARCLVIVSLLLVPSAVAFSRLYRGMHHPSDVMGGLLNGACTLLVVAYVFLLPRPRLSSARFFGAVAADTLPAARTTPATGDEAPAARRAVVVRHPHGCGAELAGRVRGVLSRHGYTEQTWTETSAEHASGGLAELMADAGAALVVVCGGDGTVRACAELLAGTGTPLVVVPCGTGNLLARNLRLPADPAAALESALSGEKARIDMGRVAGDGLRTTRFTVMAGAGIDAAMVGDASERVKERAGWVAYVLSAVRHLRDPRMRLSIRLDEGPVRERRARMVVIGNVGTVQGGVQLLPDARPDSGRLEVVLLDPRGARGWLATAGHLGARMLPGRAAAGPLRGYGRVAGGALEYFSAARVDIRFARPQPRELDGDVIGSGTRLSAQVEPGVLCVWLPPSALEERQRTPTARTTEVTGGAGRADEPRTTSMTGPAGRTHDSDGG
ncbi:diacylglycerol kinase family protein [Streptomyces sp. NPDC059385]|uniref:diacylglycerol kinase family protein n=1 Tax=Streptomyces sp. NPDC059385 TaxID=3346817 RepID=UPI0036BC42E2